MVLAATAALVTAASAQDAQAPKSDRWLHVRLENVEAKGEMVRVNVPLDLAEKVLPTINNERLQKDKLRLEGAAVSGVDLRGVLEAMRSSKDGEYLTIQGHDGDVRLFEMGGYLEAHIQRVSWGLLAT